MSFILRFTLSRCNEHTVLCALPDCQWKIQAAQAGFKPATPVFKSRRLNNSTIKLVEIVWRIWICIVVGAAMHHRYNMMLFQRQLSKALNIWVHLCVALCVAAPDQLSCQTHSTINSRDHAPTFIQMQTPKCCKNLAIGDWGSPILHWLNLLSRGVST